MVEDRFTVTLDQKVGYEFEAGFEQVGIPPLLLDEPPPLGQGRGPSASRLLAAAVGDCLSASALYCLRRARINVWSMHTEVHATLKRNEQGRLRITGLTVRIEPEVANEDVSRMKRCLDIFQDYCIVTESVRQGIAIDVAVDAPTVAAVA